MKTYIDYEFHNWLIKAIKKLFGEIDLSSDRELLMLYQRAERRYKRGHSLHKIKKILEEYKRYYWTKRKQK